MKALAISNFPDDYNEEKLRPEFSNRGVEIRKFYTGPDFKDVTVPSDVEAVYCFIDLMSHNQYQTAKTLVHKQGRKFHMLTRKVASWPSDIFGTTDISTQTAEETSVVETKKRGAPKSVRDEDLVPMLMKYTELVDANSSPETMTSELKKYWFGRPLNNYGQMYNYVNRVTEYGTTPEFFAKWCNMRKAKVASESKPVETEIEHQEPVAQETASALEPVEEPVEKSVEYAEMIKLYEEENLKLHEEVAKLKTVKTQPQASPNDRTKKIAEALKMLIETKAMSPESAFDILSSNL
jgi:hypothetical protein